MDSDECLEMFDGWGCSLRAGHSVPHIAYNSIGMPCAIWDHRVRWERDGDRWDVAETVWVPLVRAEKSSVTGH